MEQKLLSLEQNEEILDEDLILDYEEYTDFNNTQNEIYKDLYVEKLLKNDSIKFY